MPPPFPQPSWLYQTGKLQKHWYVNYQLVQILILIPVNSQQQGLDLCRGLPGCLLMPAARQQWEGERAGKAGHTLFLSLHSDHRESPKTCESQATKGSSEAQDSRCLISLVRPGPVHLNLLSSFFIRPLCSNAERRASCCEVPASLMFLPFLASSTMASSGSICLLSVTPCLPT